MKTSEPYPGSDEAYEQGCLCPRMDNGYGKGYFGGVKDEDGDIVFAITEGCPLHDLREEGKDE